MAGTRPGSHPQNLCLHQPHPAAGGAGDLAGGAVGELLPRHLEIIYEINHRFLDEVRIRFIGDEAKMARMSLIDEGNGARAHGAPGLCGQLCHQRRRRAAHGAAQTDGTARLLRAVAGEVQQQVTNGVTPRRWVVLSNPRLTALITETCGDDRWIATWMSEGLEPTPRTVASGAPGARSRSGQAGSGQLARAAHRDSADPDSVRRPGQAHPRVQAPAPEPAAHHLALRADQAEPQRST
jgi:hypothetical protein